MVCIVFGDEGAADAAEAWNAACAAVREVLGPKTDKGAIAVALPGGMGVIGRAEAGQKLHLKLSSTFMKAAGHPQLSVAAAKAAVKAGKAKQPAALSAPHVVTAMVARIASAVSGSAKVVVHMPRVGTLTFGAGSPRTSYSFKAKSTTADMVTEPDYDTDDD